MKQAKRGGARKGSAERAVRRALPEDDPFVVARERLYVEVQANLASAMEASGLTRSELARRLGVDRAHVTRILSGERGMSLATVADAFAACGYAAHVTFDAKADRVEVVTRPPRAGTAAARASIEILEEDGSTSRVRVKIPEMGGELVEVRASKIRGKRTSGAIVTRDSYGSATRRARGGKGGSGA